MPYHKNGTLGNSLRSFLQRVARWCNHVSGIAQWGSLKFALKQFSYHRRATAVKAIHRHLPTQDKLSKQGRVTMCALCPRCMSAPETNAHVYACTQPDAIKQRSQDWGEFQKQLVKLNTARLLLDNRYGRLTCDLYCHFHCQMIFSTTFWSILMMNSPLCHKLH